MKYIDDIFKDIKVTLKADLYKEIASLESAILFNAFIIMGSKQDKAIILIYPQ